VIRSLLSLFLLWPLCGWEVKNTELKDLPEDLREKFLEVRKSVSASVQCDMDDALGRARDLDEFRALLEEYLSNLMGEIEYAIQEVVGKRLTWEVLDFL